MYSLKYNEDTGILTYKIKFVIDVYKFIESIMVWIIVNCTSIGEDDYLYRYGISDITINLNSIFDKSFLIYLIQKLIDIKEYHVFDYYPLNNGELSLRRFLDNDDLDDALKFESITVKVE